MLYPCDFEIKRTKEREIRERIQRAETDRLILSIRPQQEGLIRRSLRRLLYSVGHLLVDAGRQLDAPIPETQLAHKLNAK